jgi:hypothetical protein
VAVRTLHYTETYELILRCKTPTVCSSSKGYIKTNAHGDRFIEHSGKRQNLCELPAALSVVMKAIPRRPEGFTTALIDRETWDIETTPQIGVGAGWGGRQMLLITHAVGTQSCSLTQHPCWSCKPYSGYGKSHTSAVHTAPL